MIKFIKTPDPDNPYDTSEVIFTLPNQLTRDEVVEEFKLFLLAMSYSIPDDDDEALFDIDPPEFSTEDTFEGGGAGLD